MALTYKHTKYACYAGYIVQAIIVNFLPLLFAMFQTDFGISVAKLGLLASVNFAIQLTVDLLGAKIADKAGYRAVMVTANFLAAAGLICLAFLPYVFKDPYAGLLISVIIYGIGGGLTEVLVSPMIEALPTEGKASSMSLLHSFYSWGQAGVILLSVLFFVTAGISRWRILSLVWAVIPVLTAVLFLFVPIKTLDHDGKSVPVKKLFANKIFWLFFVLMICSGAAEQGISQWASLFAEKGLGVSKTLGDIVGPCCFALLMGAGRLFFGIKGDKIDLRKYILLSGLLCIASYLLASVPGLFTDSMGLLSLIGCALCGLSVAIMWPGVLSLAADNNPAGGTAMFALLALGGDIGCISGSGIVGTVSDASSLNIGILSAIIFPVLIVICITVLIKRPLNRTLPEIPGRSDD